MGAGSNNFNASPPDKNLIVVDKNNILDGFIFRLQNELSSGRNLGYKVF